MILVNESGAEVKIGDVYYDFRNEYQYRVERIIPPHKVGSTGRVQCVNLIDTSHIHEFYPGVLRLRWEEPEKGEK